MDPVAYDCVKLIFIRSGSAVLLSEFGEQPVSPGDVVLLEPNTLCGSEPEGFITVTTVYLDHDYLVDQVFWQNAALLNDRFEASELIESIYVEPAQILHVGEDRVGMLWPWLDELVELSLDGPEPERFYRLQALLFAVLDVLIPYVRTNPVRVSTSQRLHIRPTLPRSRQFAPLRPEAARVRELLRGDIRHPWALQDLAEQVHLSPKQLARVFVDAYGKTPNAYLTMLRVQAMAKLLRDATVSILEAGQAVGWASRSRASEAFRQCIGVSPQRFRARLREAA
ncbi:AraC family transcriptional regulator [Nesterenkonia sp. CL21]|nr:AraC family transcriptional regulator [Nesterenkonia sp. CL21]